MKFIISSIFFIGFLYAANAYDCNKFKINPDIELKQPTVQKQVLRSSVLPDVHHGNVLASLSENFELGIESIKIDNGYCIVLSEVDSEIGYEKFSISIDDSHNDSSCEYNAILKHEDEHIKVYLKVIEENEENIYNSIQQSANMVMPVFISNMSEIEVAMDKMHQDLSNNPELKLMLKRIMATQEFENKKLDYSGEYNYLDKCKKIILK